MAAVRVLVTIVVSLCLWNMGASGIGRRRKRISYGIEVSKDKGEPPGFSAIRYTVWIGNGHERSKYDVEEQTKQHQLAARTYNMVCTGVLLAPDVVQVPCTCVSTFTGSQSFTSVSKAVPLIVWEDVYEVFFAEVVLDRMNWFILSKHYIVYDKCGSLNVQKLGYRNNDNYIIHDYGLIVLRKRISDVPPAAISYAPSPTKDGISRFYQEALHKEYICLFFGFGDTTYGTSRWNVRRGTSDFLRYGWRSLMSYPDCYSVSIELNVNLTNLPKEFNYQRDATWVCDKPRKPWFGPDVYQVEDNDRGGPVTCNEEYFGFISKSAIILEAWTDHFYGMNIMNPIVFTLWENAVEYRELFIRDLRTKLKGKTLFPAPFKERIEFKPDFTPTTEHFYYMSRSPAISGSVIYSTFFTLMFKNLP